MMRVRSGVFPNPRHLHQSDVILRSIGFELARHLFDGSISRHRDLILISTVVIRMLELDLTNAAIRVKSTRQKSTIIHLFFFEDG
jgi:hypothetical protein